MEETEDGATCLIKYQWFKCKRNLEEYDKDKHKGPFILKLAQKKYTGLCEKCIPKDVVCYEEDLDLDDVKLWHHETQRTLEEHQKQKALEKEQRK